MDTSSGAVKLSCCEHYGNVLHEYSDPELRAVRGGVYSNDLEYLFLLQIIDVATRREDHLKSDMISNYKEVNYYGAGLPTGYSVIVVVTIDTDTWSSLLIRKC